jgi:putative transposase
MPDHIHFFVRLAPEAQLGVFVKMMKQSLTRTVRPLADGRFVWQPGFFDHLLRHGESYAEKWQYVWQNPVRAGLVSNPEEWPFQGEVVRLEM